MEHTVKLVYKIYKKVAPRLLDAEDYNSESYSYREVERYVLQNLDIWGFKDTHTTMEDALAEIQKFSEKLVYLDVVIIPSVQITYNY